MTDLRTRHDGRGSPRAVDFPDCASEELHRASVRRLASDPSDIDAFARSIEGFAKICRFADGSPSKWGYYTEAAPIPIGEHIEATPQPEPVTGPDFSVRPAGEESSFDFTTAALKAAGALAAAGAAVLSAFGIKKAVGSIRSQRAAEKPPRDRLLQEILRDVRDSATIVPGALFEPEPRRGTKDPASGSDSVTTAWDRNARPKPSGAGAEALLNGLDIFIPPDPSQGLPAAGVQERTTIPAPPPDDRVLAELPKREARWEAFAQRGKTPETKALVQLARQMRSVLLYADLGREDVERRAQYHFENWMAVDEAKREQFVRSVPPGALFSAGEELIPHLWVMRQEASLNARLRLSENPLYASMPDYETSRYLLSKDNRFKHVLALAKYERLFPGKVVQTDIDHNRSIKVAIEHDGPARLVVRSAIALVSNYNSMSDIPEEVFSKEGLARLLVANSSLSPDKKLADRLGRMIEFSNKAPGILVLEARNFLNRWLDLPIPTRRQIVMQEMSAGDQERALYHTEQRELSRSEIAQIKLFEVNNRIEARESSARSGSARTAAALDHPPDSWLRWQRQEKNAWFDASASKSHDLSTEAREIHRQLYDRSNPEFVRMGHEDRYAVSRHLAEGFNRFKDSNTFRELFMNREGYISPEGIGQIVDLIDAPPEAARRGLDVSRRTGLRMQRWMRRENLSKPIFKNRAPLRAVK